MESVEDSASVAKKIIEIFRDFARYFIFSIFFFVFSCFLIFSCLCRKLQTEDNRRKFSLANEAFPV